jgi:uncharacterized protein YbcV (DUF1398 family)
MKEINQIHEKFGKAETLVQYLKALRLKGIIRQDSFIEDGHSEYYSEDGLVVASPPVHTVLKVADESDRGELLRIRPS